MNNITYIKDFTEWKKDFKFYVPIRVRFSETDMFGHVNNVSAFIYFEQARIDFFKDRRLFMNFDDPNISGVPVVADLQCDFHKQMFFDDQIKLYVKVATIGRTSLDIHYMAINEQDDICLTGRGRIVYINRHTGKPMPLTDDIVQKLTN
ncbi:MAG TPA: thioesterase family protein [Bacillota bacterium]|nr:thioesterase family protein [Bacillota bacterium]